MSEPSILTRGAGRLLAAAVLAVGMLAGGPAPAQDSIDDLKSLRQSPVDRQGDDPSVNRVREGDRFVRAFRHQPPLVPHEVDQYEIDLKVNRCLRCHQWPYAEQENAPTISNSHYRTREGVELDEVSRSRWFCTQCHVPQTDVDTLVRNTFQPLLPAN